ncbi:MAG: anthranilate phosphoribosyltransferase [Ignavibacteriales bacterium]|nr:anthranilate phosphoribosyltransferase [Ignavibacteriales bacterium]
MIKEVIIKLAEHQDLSSPEAYEAMIEIMSGNASDAQIAGFLMGLRLKGETPEEISGCARAMREKAVRIQAKHPAVIDTCGTGGDASGTFNISTTAAIIASAAGAAVAKHGNRAVSSRCGSADVLKALGVNIDIPVEKVSKVLEDVGITFLFAPVMHQAMKYAVGVRKDLAIRTIFNILGPLTNPAGAKRQVLGVFQPSLTETMALVLKDLGSDHALVVHGDGGLDELSTVGETKVSELRNGQVTTYQVRAKEVGVETTSADAIRGGGIATNVEIIQGILGGMDGAPREIAVLNAGAALFVAGKASSLKGGVQDARAAIDNGSAKRKLQQWIEATNS